MQTNYLFFYRFQSVFFKKVAVLLAVFFFSFNIVFSPYAKSINLNIEVKIQKDVFSAVFAVSETIGKISASISNIFSLKSDVSRKNAEEKPVKNEVTAAGDILFLNQPQSKKSDAGNGLSVLKAFSKGTFVAPLIYESHLRKRPDRSIVSNFLERMLIYISSKSTYDSIVSLNNINILFYNPS